MSGSLRVFISSTMRDLANERAEIVERLKSLGLSPVNAEGFRPDGRTSWQKIEDGIKSSHIFVLVLGDGYGWVPTEGYGWESCLSVTHLEFRLAKELGLPVLPFLKNLEYSTKERDEEAIQRDSFREEVEAWSGGYIRANFNLARDLGELVQLAVVEYLCEPLLKKVIGQQDARVQHFLPPPPIKEDRSFGVSPTLDVVPEDCTLIAGAGLSISAGFPSALAFAQSLSRKLGADGTVTGTGTLELMCELYEARFGRAALIEEAHNIINLDFSTEPTKAHLIAVNNFKIIITSNYDYLFEQACNLEGVNARVLTRRTLADARPLRDIGDLYILKLSGDLRIDKDLVFTNEDYRQLYDDEAMWQFIDHLVLGTAPVVVGHSISTPDVQRLVKAMSAERRGYFVSPQITPITKALAEHYNLVPVSATADEFMSSVVAMEA